MSQGAFGEYNLHDPLGSGSMGVVRRAVHRPSGRVVALKTVHLADPIQLSNLRAEIAALARLSHPGIAAILDHGTHDGSPFIAMEIIEGESLRDLIEREPVAHPGMAADPLALRRILGIFAHLARALAHMHGEGIVHRDLKPANVLVRRDGLPVIVDFGLARRRSSGTRESLDAQRGAVGTALYMSPEQILRQLVDARADLYSLGAMLHTAVAGAPPFLGEDVSAVLTKHVVELPMRLSSVVRNVPLALDELVASLLEKDRHKRLPYALDVVDALDALDARSMTSLTTATGAATGAATIAATRAASAAAPCAAPAPRPYVYDADLQGRDGALQRAAAAFACLAEGRGAALVVVGESGSGKTRFVSEAMEGLSYDHLLGAGTCETVLGDARGEAGGARTLSGLRPLLRATVDRLRAEPAHAERVLGDEGPLLSLYEPELLPLFDPARGAPLPAAAALPERLVTAVLGLVRRLSTLSPVVVVIDDLQWADAITLEWARRAAAGALIDVPVVVVLSVRAENALPIGEGVPSTVRIEIAPLDAASMLEITRQMLGTKTIERELADLVAAAQGNPFALASAIRTAAEEGSLVREGRGRWRLAPSAALSARLHESGTHVAASMAKLRLRAVSEDARWLATALAAMGSGSTLDDVAAVAFAGDLDRAGRAAHEVVRRGVGTRGFDGSMALAHDKLREAAYELAGTDGRARLHAGAANRILASRPRSAESLAMVAQHRALARDPRGAALAALDASSAFEERGASNDALQHAEAASAAASSLDPGDEVSRRAAVRLGGLLVALGAVPRATPLLERARAAAAAASDTATLAAAHVHLGYASYLKGELEAMFTHAGEGARAAAAVGDRRLLARAENALGIAWGSSGRFQRAIEHYARAAEHARDLGDVPSVGRFLSNISINHRLLGNLADAERCARDALDATRAAPTTHANAWCNLGRILFEAERPVEAEEAFDRALAIAIRTHNAVVSAEATWGLALAALAKGEPHAAAARAEQSLAIAREAQMSTAEALALRALGWIQALGASDAASFARARATLDASLAILETTPERDELADALRARAFARSSAGDATGAAGDLAAARAIYAELGMSGRLRSLNEPMKSWACF